MGWDIKNDGFGVVLSAQLPNLIQERFVEAVDGFLRRAGLTRADIAGYLMHPGGAKVLDVAERILDLPRLALEPSRETLRTYGNMSSATALFVLKYAIKQGRRGRHLLVAFGPGFSAYFMVIDL
jgi:alkylresorcinol/alkylpyrone synthase